MKGQDVSLNVNARFRDLLLLIPTHWIIQTVINNLRVALCLLNNIGVTWSRDNLKT